MFSIIQLFFCKNKASEPIEKGQKIPKNNFFYPIEIMQLIGGDANHLHIPGTPSGQKLNFFDNFFEFKNLSFKNLYVQK